VLIAQHRRGDGGVGVEDEDVHGKSLDMRRSTPIAMLR
jgi:hypothetical protein